MSAKIPADRMNHAIELYLSGEPAEKIYSDTGISSSTLHRARIRLGIPPRRHHQLPNEQIVTAYISGASELALSRQYSVSRPTITRVLHDAGVERRSVSEAAKMSAANSTPEERAARVKEANKARRMQSVPKIDLLRRALARELRQPTKSDGEAILHNMLVDRGETPQAERAVGPYNIDLALLPVAVEVLGGGQHAYRSSHTERTPYILDAGWHLVMVWDTEGSSAIGPGAADYLITFANEVRRNPPATCQYRVISGDGEILATRGREDNEFPVVRPPRRTIDVRS